METKRIVRVNWVEGYNMSLLFCDGASKVVDFEPMFGLFGTTSKMTHVNGYPDVFAAAKVVGGVLQWPSVGIFSEDESGAEVFHAFEPDPIVLYESGVVDTKPNIMVGDLIRKLLRETGISRTELASKAGTTKQYISRLERGNADIQVGTLARIVKQGFGRTLTLSLE